MASDKQHKGHARHNLKFLQSFYPSREFDDWSVTVAFYAAVQIVEYVTFVSEDLRYNGHAVSLKHSGDLRQLAKEKGLVSPGNIAWSNCSHHIIRNLIVQHSFPESHNYYNELYKASIKARYHKFMWLPLEVPLLIDQFLNPIIRWANDEWGLGLRAISEQKTGQRTEKKK